MPYHVPEVLARLTPEAMRRLRRLAAEADAAQADTLAVVLTADILSVLLAQEGQSVADDVNAVLATQRVGWRLVPLS